MTSEVLVIISKAEKDKALAGISSAVNTQKFQWIQGVKVISLGPFENIVCEDEEVAAAASQLIDFETPIACHFFSDRDGIGKNLMLSALAHNMQTLLFPIILETAM